MYIDLTHCLEEDISVFPGTGQPVIKPIVFELEQGVTCQVSNLHIESHHGTHMDAPCHFVKGAQSVDMIPIQRLMGNGIVVNLLDRSIQDVKQQVEDIKEVDFILFRTGMASHWKTAAYQKPFPMITPQIAEILTKKKLKGIGVDCLSIDLMDSKDYQVHRIVLGSGMFAIQNLGDLTPLIGKSFQFTCLPLKIKGCDGSPVRAFAKILN